MKNSARLIFQVVLQMGCLIAVSSAQETSVGFPNGITVAIKTEVVSVGGDRASISSGVSGAGTAGNPMHRVVRDAKSMRYFGYDLNVTREMNQSQFRVSISPLSVNPGKLLEVNGYTEIEFPKFQEDILVEDGDTIEMEVLRNPTSNARVIDLIKITTENVPFGTHFAERLPARNFTFEDVEMKLDQIEIMIGDERFKINGSASGQLVWVYVKDKGRFIFSFTPQPGYNFNKIGSILNNLIEFEHEGVKYQFKGKSLVLGSSGKWNLWVMIDRDYVSKRPHFLPKLPLSSESAVEFGAASDATWLFR